MDEVKTP